MIVKYKWRETETGSSTAAQYRGFNEHRHSCSFPQTLICLPQVYITYPLKIYSLHPAFHSPSDPCIQLQLPISSLSLCCFLAVSMLFLYSQTQINHADIAMPIYHWILAFFLFICLIFFSLCVLFHPPVCPVSASPLGPVHLFIPVFSCVFPTQLIPGLIKFFVSYNSTHSPKKPSPGLF